LDAELKRRLDRHGQLIAQLVRFCGLQSTMIGLIAGQLKQLSDSAPPGVGNVALALAAAHRDLVALVAEEHDDLPPEARKVIIEILGGS
jgi:hypothetical protein